MTENAFLKHAIKQLSERRQTLFAEVLKYRTNHIKVVMEDFYQPHNFSAVLRSCDIFGINSVHIIENLNRYQTNPKVNMGSDKWVNITKHNELENNTLACFNTLKKDGYKIVAAHPHAKQCDLPELDISQKTAILFGTEKAGISEIAKENADAFVCVPMYGFTESFNVSVAAALTLSSIRERLNNSEINWQLSPEEKDNILDTWLSRCVNGYEELRKEFFNQRKF